MSGRPVRPGEDEADAGGHESALLSELKKAAALITPLGLSGGECGPAAARLRLLLLSPPLRILAHSATSSSGALMRAKSWASSPVVAVVASNAAAAQDDGLCRGHRRSATRAHNNSIKIAPLTVGTSRAM